MSRTCSSFRTLLNWAYPALVAISVLVSGVRGAGAELLNVQFGTDGSTRRVGPAALGQATNDFWNLYSRDLPGGGYKVLGGLENLLWTDKTYSGAGLTLQNAPGAWGNGFPDAMFGIYLYCFDGQPVTLTFTNLPPGTYDVLAYGHGGPPNVQNTAFEVFSGGASRGSGRTSTRSDWTNTVWAEGVHYVHFREVPVFTNHPLVLVSSPDAIPLALLNGVQLRRLNGTPVGEPATNPPVEPPPAVGTNGVPATNNQPAGLLNINFGVDQTATRLGPAAVGQDSSDYWNLYSRDDGAGGFRHNGSLNPLYWANGTISGSGLEVENAAGAWGNGVLDAMFGIFLYPLSANPVVRVTVTNLPPGLYSALIYAHGGPPNDQNTTVELIAGGKSLGDQTTRTSDWNHTNWTEGAQFVRYTNVLIEPDTPLVILAKPASHTFGMINGLQLRLEAPLALQVIPAGGLFTNELMVRLVGALPSQEIRYTLDGTDPATNSLLYRVPVRLQSAALLKARVFEHGEPVGSGVTSSFQRVYGVNDGITAEWRRQHFGEGYLTDPRVAADADPDGDGANNLQEFATGSDPLDSLSGFLVRTRLVPSITWKSEPGTAYRIRRKDSLSDPGWKPVAEVTATEPISRFIDADVANVDSFYIVEPVR